MTTIKTLTHPLPRLAAAVLLLAGCATGEEPWQEQRDDGTRTAADTTAATVAGDTLRIVADTAWADTLCFCFDTLRLEATAPQGKGDAHQAATREKR